MPNTDYLKTAASGLTKPTDYLTQQVDAFNQQYSASMDVTGVLAPIIKWLDTLPESQQLPIVQGILKTLQAAPSSDLLGATTASISKLLLTSGQTVAQQQPATPQTPAQTATTAANTAQSTATTAATTATAQLPDLTTGASGAGIPVVGASGAAIPGTSTPSDFNSLLQNYYTTAFSQ